MRRCQSRCRSPDRSKTKYLPRRPRRSIRRPVRSAHTSPASRGRHQRGSRTSRRSIVRPSRRGASRRRIVSTSGSSGIALYGRRPRLEPRAGLVGDPVVELGVPRRRRGGPHDSRLTLAAARPAALLAVVLALAPSPAAGEALAPGLSWTTEVRPDGPLRLNVIALDRAVYAGRLTTVLSNGTVLGRETVSSMAARHGALAAVNGTYYVVGGPDDGDPVGAVVAGGRLVSEPVDGREALVVPADRAAPVRLERLAWSGRVTVGARTRLLDGIERERGVIWGCGGRGGDQPGERPRHGVPPCRDPSELVALSPAFGARTPPAGREATEAAVRIERADGAATSGTVVAVRRGGSTPIPRDGLVLSGSGDAAALLVAARRGDPVRLATALRAGGRV